MISRIRHAQMQQREYTWWSVQAYTFYWGGANDGGGFTGACLIWWVIIRYKR
jgi:hypothetical protein